jgi:hypothetical protein
MRGRGPTSIVAGTSPVAQGGLAAALTSDGGPPGLALCRRRFKRRFWPAFLGQEEPFMEAGVPFALAISPTKAFVTFALRPCGFVLVFHPDKAKGQAMAPKLAGLVRARGSSFEHPVTRAFVKAMVRDRVRLEDEHARALARNAEAERDWQTFAKGTAMEPLFSHGYAGLFRNPKAKPEAARTSPGCRPMLKRRRRTSRFSPGTANNCGSCAPAHGTRKHQPVLQG